MKTRIGRPTEGQSIMSRVRMKVLGLIVPIVFWLVGVLIHQISLNRIDKCLLLI